MQSLGHLESVLQEFQGIPWDSGTSYEFANKSACMWFPVVLSSSTGFHGGWAAGADEIPCWMVPSGKEKHLPLILSLRYTLFGPQMNPCLHVPHVAKDSLVKTTPLAFALYLLYP